MSAGVSDKITDTRNAARPNSAKATGTRSAGGTSLACDSLTGWPTASKVHFVTYQADSDSVPIAGTQLDCYGIVSGSTIGSISVIDGSDTGNSVNDVVEMLPTAAWGQDLADALTTEHSRTGTHTSITATSLTASGAVTATGNVQSSAALIADTVSEKTPAAGVTVDSLLIKDGNIRAFDKSVLTTDSNPYKFHAVQTVGVGPFSSATKITFTSETFDTNSNFASSTYTAPVTGFYFFYAYIHTSPTGGDTSTNMALYKNGVSSQVLAFSGGVNLDRGLSGSIMLSLTAGNTIEIYAFSSGGNISTVASGTDTPYFGGYLISKT